MKFSPISQARLNTCHPDLRMIFATAIQQVDIDFAIAEGNRSTDRQRQLFAEGKSEKDGTVNISKHNHYPSLAVDILPVYRGDPAKRERAIEYLAIYLAGQIMLIAGQLLAEGKIRSRLRWGGNWDQDQEIMTDQKFQDLVHFEL